MNRFSIRWRMTLWNVAAFAAALALFGTAIYLLMRETHYRQLDRRLASEAEAIVEEIRNRNPQQAADRLVEFAAARDFDVVLVNERYDVVLQSTDSEALELSSLRDSINTESPFGTVEFADSTRSRGHLRVAEIDGASYRLYLLAELDHVDEELALVAHSLLWTIPLTLAFAALLSYLLARAAFAPVERLRREADAISAANLHRRLDVACPTDEIGKLAATVNSLIERLEIAFDEIKRFTADASHELRTPVAVMRSEAELGHAAAGDEEQVRGRFRSVIEECDRMTAMTSQLLILSREDASLAEREGVVSSPVLCLKRSAEVLGSIARERDIEIVVQGDERLQAAGSEERLRRIFDNLIENAIKYSRRDGQVRAVVRDAGADVEIVVEDDGIGIPQEFVERVFDRFFRIDRTDASPLDGAGLGLSIVRRAVLALGGSVFAKSELGRGSVFIVRLPAVNRGLPMEDAATAGGSD